jgi:hypothetical protein
LLISGSEQIHNCALPGIARDSQRGRNYTASGGCETELDAAGGVWTHYFTHERRRFVNLPHCCHSSKRMIAVQVASDPYIAQ